jgi:predicted nuclease of predicted toxin-antitoxin system
VTLYLDQMLREDLAQLLRAEGHDVLRASEVGQRRADDGEILASAQVQGRIVITVDSDFGDWTVLPLKEHLGVIRL